MQIESHLDQMIEDLSEEKPSIEDKTSEVIANLEQQRIQKYFYLATHIRFLKAQDQITETILNQSFDKLIQSSGKEFEHPLAILELERNIGISAQYEKQKQTLQNLGILQELPESHKSGIIGVDGREYPLPNLLEISQSISPEHLELLQTKISQGFTELLLTPFAASLDKLIEHYKQLLLSKHREGKLLSTEGERLTLKENNPVYIWEDYLNADQHTDHPKGIVYYPKQYDQIDHQGQSKQQLLDNAQNDAWHISLIENLPDLPAEGQGKTISGRKQLEANKSAKNYFNLLFLNPAYRGEQGLTIEDSLTYAISYLHQNNIQIDDCHGRGKACYNLASYFPANFISFCDFDRNAMEASISAVDIDKPSSAGCARSLVKII